MPEPDIVITDYRGSKAVPLANVALVVEISDTTLNFDLGQKAAIYAEAGVPEYWVVDVDGSRILIHADRISGRYAERKDYPLGIAIEARTLTGVTVQTGGLVD